MSISSLLSVSLLASTIIGAGIFSLPYVFGKVGIGVGAVYLLFFALLYSIVHGAYARILETEPEPHQFSFFLEKYFGHVWGRLAGYMMLIELFLVLTAYLILSPLFIEAAFGFGGMPALLAFWAFGSLFFFVRVRTLGFADMLGIGAILGVVALVVWFGFRNPMTVPFANTLGLFPFLLPFGPVLFSLSGRPAIGKVVEEKRNALARGESFSLGRVIALGTLIPAVIYFFFVFGILRLNPSVSPEVLDSLGMLPSWVTRSLGLLGIVAIWTSYFMVGANARDTMREDMRTSSLWSAAIVLFLPLLLYLAGLRHFLEVVSFIGGTLLALEGICILLLWKKVFPRNPFRYYVYPLLAVFLITLIFEITKTLL